MTGRAKSEQIKEVKIRLDKDNAKLNIKESECKLLQSEVSKLRNDIKILQNKLKQLQDDSPVEVTDHAIVRYIERVMGVDLENLKLQIVSKKNRDIIENIQSGKIKTDDYTIIYKNKQVTTIY